MRTVCAWDGQDDLVCDPSWLLADDGKPDGRTSHGICEAHAEAMREKLRAAEAKPGCCFADFKQHIRYDHPT